MAVLVCPYPTNKHLTWESFFKRKKVGQKRRKCQKREFLIKILVTVVQALKHMTILVSLYLTHNYRAQESKSSSE